MTRMRHHGVGDLIAERFELQEPLGAGRTGTVWRARDLLLEREVVLKEVRPTAEEDPDQSAVLRMRVLREARALAKVQHANVVANREVVDQKPYPWLVMELIVGRSLRELLLAGPLAAARTARIGLDVLAALHAAHDAEVLHRDVKPDNVLIRADGAAMLTGFGKATVGGAQAVAVSVCGRVTGSLEYTAPEQLRGGEIGPAADMWSLGMVLYVCVEGDTAMRRDWARQRLSAVREQPPPPMTRAGALAPLIAALLDPQPELRPSATRLSARLRAAAEQKPGTR